ncbi:MAG: hypothetical protein HBSAPP02_09470 [Phycisphaerae bacterium]|nr:MAG: thermonuclease family protein [Planctomycetia bacterium]RIK69679.1 MAG: hypothetical protein DCC66_07925 [Planctomycetota bacterium]GJQ25915.1 MAG: hypothetical protein HBSAPP02_09470 [Phycisphaerae bacterium]
MILLGSLGLFPLVAHAEEGTCYGSKDSKVFHTDAACPSGKKIIAENRIPFKSAADAEEQGRRLCRTCERRMAAGKAREEKDATAPLPPSPKDEPAHEKKSGRGKNAASQPADRSRNGKSTSDGARSLIDPVRQMTVRQVLPGGAMVLDDGEKVHLLGVCCPEDRQPLAAEAVAHIEKLVKSRKCEQSWDGPASRPELRNENGQLLLYVAAGPNRIDLGGELIEKGLAWVDRDRPCTKTDDYLAREHLAWSEGRGIWRRLDGLAGQARVLTGQYARHYHPTDCPHEVHLNEPSEITVNEAKARRLAPCCFYRAGPPVTATARKTETAAKGTQSREPANRHAKSKD